LIVIFSSRAITLIYYTHIDTGMRIGLITRWQ